MPRAIPFEFQDLLDLGNCETQTTLSLFLADTTELHVATRELTANSENFTGDLLTCRELKQSAFQSPDRVVAVIQNVDKLIGKTAFAEDLTKAVGVVGRYYRDPRGVVASQWVELFRGEAQPVRITEGEAELEILSDLTAAGYCVAAASLAENCQWRFKGIECGYSGVEAACNKKRRSPGGCQGRSNEHRFGGMEYPDPQLGLPPTGTGGGIGGGEPGTGGGGWGPGRYEPPVIIE